jgi:hypothetical protein
MKRWLFGILLLCNAVALAWQWDVFDRWGWGPNVNREPERLQQQIRPEAVTITLPPRPEASDAGVAASPVLEASASSSAATETPLNASSAPASTSAGASTGAPPSTASSAASSAPTPAAAARPDAKTGR